MAFVFVFRDLLVSQKLKKNATIIPASKGFWSTELVPEILPPNMSELFAFSQNLLSSQMKIITAQADECTVYLFYLLKNAWLCLLDLASRDLT